MSKRKSIYIPGFVHSNPIPAGCLVGNVLMTGLLSGRHPETHKMPEDFESQMLNVFSHIREVVEAAGGTTEDIVKLNFWLADPANRGDLNGPYLEMFPDEASRPARHTHQLHADASQLIHADVTAVID